MGGWLVSNFLFGFGNCPSVKGAMEVGPDWLNSSGTVVSPGLASGLADGAEMPVHPIFHDLPRCIFQWHVGSTPLVYTIVLTIDLRHRPREPDDARRCLQLSEFWFPIVG